MNPDCWRIFDVFPEPIILVTLAGTIVGVNKAAYGLFPLLLELNSHFLPDLLGIDVQKLEKWLRAWGRSTSMVQGSLPIRQKDGSCLKIALEAAGVHQSPQNPLVILRFQKNHSMLHKFVSLNERVTHLHQEIAKQKVIESQLRIQYRKLMSKNQHLASLASQDGLTGLANRRLFDEVLLDYWQEAAQHPYSLSIILLDIDHFKLYNDTYGHPEGDVCLKAVASDWQSNSRGTGFSGAVWWGRICYFIEKKRRKCGG